jgi:spore germination cell wall hydrolase CwlJ-like protein
VICPKKRRKQKMKYFIGFLVGVFFVISCTQYPISAVAQDKISEVDFKDMECMAKAIYFESKDEPLVGQLAVGLVVKNRSTSDMFPKDICSVVYQGKHDSKGKPLTNQCQFSWYCDGKPEKILDTAKWERALFLAKVILMDRIFDFTDGALFFHNASVTPKWGMKRIGSIGNHIFYKKT